MDHAADVFFGVVVHGLMAGIALHCRREVRTAIGEDLGGRLDKALQRRLDRLVVYAGNDAGLHVAVPSYQANNGHFLGDGLTVMRILCLAAHIGFIHFNNPAQLLKVSILHSVADTMAHMPGALIGQFKHTTHLQCADTLLAGAKNRKCNHPLIKADFGIFKDGAARNSVLTFADPALVKTSAARSAFQLGGLADGAAVMTDRTRRPQHAFQVGARRVGIGEALHKINQIERAVGVHARSHTPTV